jgi:hypothetical protein
MPDQETIERARKDKREGKAATTQAGEFVREEMHHIREGKHGAKSTRQAIAIGLSKARRAGVNLPPPAEDEAPTKTRRQAKRELRRAASGSGKRTSPTRSKARTKALKRESRAAASKTALSRHARAVARKKTDAERSAAARKAARTRRQSAK